MIEAVGEVDAWLLVEAKTDGTRDRGVPPKDMILENESLNEVIGLAAPLLELVDEYAEGAWSNTCKNWLC